MRLRVCVARMIWPASACRRKIERGERERVREKERLQRKECLGKRMVQERNGTKKRQIESVDLFCSSDWLNVAADAVIVVVVAVLVVAIPYFSLTLIRISRLHSLTLVHGQSHHRCWTYICLCVREAESDNGEKHKKRRDRNITCVTDSLGRKINIKQNTRTHAQPPATHPHSTLFACMYTIIIWR